MSLHLRSSISDPQFAQVRINRFGSGWRGRLRERWTGVRTDGCIGSEDRSFGPPLAP
jgi:hypothetical protein